VGNLYYDDEYEYKVIENAEFPEGYVRAFKLSDGDVIIFNGMLLEFENNIFYAVKEGKGLINPYFERTGASFTIEELNNISI
jgi:hypothetical protein